MPSFSQSHHNQNEDPSPVRGYPKSDYTSTEPKILTFIVESIVCLLLIPFFFTFLCIASINGLHLRAFGSHHRRSQCRQMAIPQEEEDIEGYLPSFDYKGYMQVGECTVCLETFRERDVCRKLMGCCHVYHAACLDKWLVKVPNCPICRARVRLSMFGGLGGGEDESKVLW